MLLLLGRAIPSQLNVNFVCLSVCHGPARYYLAFLCMPFFVWGVIMETFLSQAKVSGSNFQQHFTEDLASSKMMPHWYPSLHSYRVYSIINRVITSAYKRAVASKCDLVRTTFMLSSSLIYCPIGFNYRT